METLGFYEHTSTTSTTWTVTSQPTPSPTPQPKVDPFADWEPTEVGRRLITGRVRWGQVLGIIMMCAGIAGIAAWLYIRPTELATEALTAVQVTADALKPSLNTLQSVNTELTSSTLDSQAATLAMLDVDRLARDLFESSGALSSEQGLARTAAADAAGAAITASRILADTLAYRDALAPLLVVPSLQTDPRVIELDAAAFEFAEWQADFKRVRDALPVGVMTEVTLALESVSGELDTVGAAYVDALRSDNPEAADAAISHLAALLDGIEFELSLGLAASQERISQRVADALASLDLLLR